MRDRAGGRWAEGGAGAVRPPLIQPILAGLAGSLPFQKHAPGILILCSLIPFFLLLTVPVYRTGVRDAFRTGWLFGVGYFLGLLHWIGLLADTEIPVRGLALGGMFVLAAYLALFPALFAAGARWANRKVPFVIAAPLLFGALEHVRTLGLLGFPWGAPGYALADQVSLIQLARAGSVDILTLAVTVVNALLAGAILAVTRRRMGPFAVRFAAAVLIVLLLGIDGVRRIRDGVAPAAPPRTVAVVQPNIKAADKWTERYKEESIRILGDLTKQAVEEGGVDLVVWPETAVPVYVRHEHPFFRMIEEIVDEVKTPILFGYPDAEYRLGKGYVYFNAAMLIDGEGNVLGEYRKMHLVPFGERLPLHDRLDWVAKLDLGEADFTPGEEFTVFRERGSAPFSANICFEAIFPPLCREFVREGATFLVNLTNDAWFGTTAAPDQHADMARLRCVELGVYLARSANTGISFIADPFGRIVESMDLYERGSVVAEITPAGGDTFYVRHGDWLPRGEIALSVILLAFAAIGRRKTRREGAPGFSFDPSGSP
ncbi:MAG: apolipoprotein N-acyltransferase [Candidatus Eisenbacteria bacterium]